MAQEENYKIVAKYLTHKGYEVIDTATTLEEAKSLVDEHKSAFGKKWDILFYRED
jgi:ribose 5-phosphate isomerase RpiB